MSYILSIFAFKLLSMILSKQSILSLLGFVFPCLIFSQTCSVTITEAEIAACKGTLARIEASSVPSSGSFLWLGLEKRTRKIDLPVEDDSQLIVQFTSSAGCIAYDTVDVKAIGFDVNITSLPATDSIEQGEILTLTAKTDPIQGAYSFEWLQNSMLMVGEDSRTLQTEANTNGDYIAYSVKITNSEGCVREERRGFDVIKAALVLPNAFTPDGDGMNDVFQLKVATGTVLIEQLQVFNRWGAIVFDGAGEAAAWDGTINGDLQPTGLYYYLARVREGKNEKLSIKKGALHLLR